MDADVLCASVAAEFPSARRSRPKPQSHTHYVRSESAERRYRKDARAPSRPFKPGVKIFWDPPAFILCSRLGPIALAGGCIGFIKTAFFACLRALSSACWRVTKIQFAERLRERAVSLLIMCLAGSFLSAARHLCSLVQRGLVCSSSSSGFAVRFRFLLFSRGAHLALVKSRNF